MEGLEETVGLIQLVYDILDKIKSKDKFGIRIQQGDGFKQVGS